MLYSEKLKEAPTFAEYFKTVREEGFEKGMEKGLEMGIEKGIEKGFEKGIEKGKMEEKRNLAAELLREGFSVEKVAKIMKLSLDEVKEIEGRL